MAYTYTKQEFSDIQQLYLSGTPLTELAEQFNKSVASIRMKLVKAGVYTKANPAVALFNQYYAKWGPGLF